MRIKKGRRSKKITVHPVNGPAVKKFDPDELTLSENEIIEACFDYVKKKGYTTLSSCWLKIPIKDKVDSLGRKRRRGIEFTVTVKKASEE